jgi:hypothetical protein
VNLPTVSLHQQPDLKDMFRQISAREFVEQLVVLNRRWIAKERQADPKQANRRWMLVMILSTGQQLDVETISAVGQSCIEVEGEINGKHVMMVAHVNTAQFISIFVPEEAPSTEPRQVGFKAILETQGKPEEVR